MFYHGGIYQEGEKYLLVLLKTIGKQVKSSSQHVIAADVCWPSLVLKSDKVQLIVNKANGSVA